MKKNIHKFDEHFIKNYDEDSDKEIFLKYMLYIPKTFIVIFHFTQRKKAKIKCNKLVCNINDKENYSQTCSNNHLYQMTTRLSQPILSPPKQITIQSLLHKTTNCLK